MNSPAATGYRAPFTALQWQELEQQALIFKYMISGTPVPPELLLPIRKSMESLRFFHHPTMGYCSFYGKKVDPEPGRCRRTDGKKWRCSKDAYPDSKYCERHMHRGRNRSRKPVENHNLSRSSSSLTSLNAAGSSNTVSYQNLPMNSMGVSQSSITNSSPIQTETNSYDITGKEYRCYPGSKPDVGEHSFFSEASGSVKGLGIESSIESSWNLIPSKTNFFSPTRQRNGFMFEGNFSHLQAMQHDVDQSNLGSAISRQSRHCYLGGEYPSDEPTKEVQSLRPFFDEWPKARDSWSDLDDERSNRSSFSTIQLSMSIPMASSDFSATSSRSPNDD